MSAQIVERIKWIDILRGIAILLMVVGNYSPILAEPHSLIYRIFKSYAAPVFMILCAYMVALKGEKHDLKYYIKRGGAIIFVAAFCDVFIYQLYPFVTYDVLYVIGLSLPISYLILKYSNFTLFTFGIVIAIAGHILRYYLDYDPEIVEAVLGNRLNVGLPRIMHALLIDGWFPVIPWISYCFFGVFLFRKFNFHQKDPIKANYLVAGLITVILGFTLLFIPTDAFCNLSNGCIIESRMGFSEIFFPLTIPYIISSIGVFIFMVKFSTLIENYSFSKFFMKFGHYSLISYVLHIALLYHILNPVLEFEGKTEVESNLIYTMIIITVILTMYLILILIDKLKRFYPNPPFLLKVLFYS